MCLARAAGLLPPSLSLPLQWLLLTLAFAFAVLLLLLLPFCVCSWCLLASGIHSLFEQVTHPLPHPLPPPLTHSPPFIHDGRLPLPLPSLRNKWPINYGQPQEQEEEQQHRQRQRQHCPFVLPIGGVMVNTHKTVIQSNFTMSNW